MVARRPPRSSAAAFSAVARAADADAEAVSERARRAFTVFGFTIVRVGACKRRCKAAAVYAVRGAGQKQDTTF
jgi:hypothetical protein